MFRTPDGQETPPFGVSPSAIVVAPTHAASDAGLDRSDILLVVLVRQGGEPRPPLRVSPDVRLLHAVPAVGLLASCGGQTGSSPVAVTLPTAITSPVGSTVTVSPVAAPPGTPVAPQEDPSCANLAVPDLHPSVIVIPRPVWVAAMTPALHAACACTRSGDAVRFVATVAPEEGTAHVIAPENEATTRCVQILDLRFPPFTVGSDCIDCGPRWYGVFHGSGPRPPPPSSIITYPFVFAHP